MNMEYFFDYFIFLKLKEFYKTLVDERYFSFVKEETKSQFVQNLNPIHGKFCILRKYTRYGGRLITKLVL